MIHVKIDSKHEFKVKKKTNNNYFVLELLSLLPWSKSNKFTYRFITHN